MDSDAAQNIATRDVVERSFRIQRTNEDGWNAAQCVHSEKPAESIEGPNESHDSSDVCSESFADESSCLLICLRQDDDVVDSDDEHEWDYFEYDQRRWDAQKAARTNTTYD